MFNLTLFDRVVKSYSEGFFCGGKKKEGKVTVLVHPGDALKEVQLISDSWCTSDASLREKECTWKHAAPNDAGTLTKSSSLKS